MAVANAAAIFRLKSDNLLIVYLNILLDGITIMI